MKCPSSHELDQYATGQLDEARSKAFEEHLEACSHCSGTLATASYACDGLTLAIRSETAVAELSDECQAVLSQSARLISSRDLPVVANGRDLIPLPVEDPVTAVENPCDRLHPPGEHDKTLIAAFNEIPHQKLLGQYELTEILGSGGMGTVYKARHVRLEKLVAVKVLEGDRASDERSRNRFEREMKAIGKLDHPNVVRAFDAGIELGRHYLVMELLKGRDLGQLSAGQTLSVSTACECIRQAAFGLSCAHSAGLIHRDIKPSNLFLTTDGVVKLLDLGLARSIEVGRTDGLSDSMTILGTIDYMSPEQAMDCRSANERSDVYSLAATLYRLITGVSPVRSLDGDTPMQRLLALTTIPPVPVRSVRPDLPQALCQLIDQSLNRDPMKRIPSAMILAERLKPFSEGACLSDVLTPAIATIDSTASIVGSRPAEDRLLHAPFHGGRWRIPFLTQIFVVTAILAVISLAAYWNWAGLRGDGNQSAANSGGVPSSAGESLPETSSGSVANAGVSHARQQQEDCAAKFNVPVEFTNSIGMRFRLIPPGEFVMGSSADEIRLLLSEAEAENYPKWFLDNIRVEGPAHKVRISRPFYVSVDETTVRNFRFMADDVHYVSEPERDGTGGIYSGTKSDPELNWQKPYPASSALNDEPVRQVTWNDAKSFCEWLATKERRQYRLPTEAEWEYACRAGTTTRFYTGETLTDQQARILGKLAGPVGRFPENPWGLRDMLGNVSEWCMDHISDTYAELDGAVDPVKVAAEDNGERVLRGGAAFEAAPRPAQRRGALPSFRADTIGFRVVCEID